MIMFVDHKSYGIVCVFEWSCIIVAFTKNITVYKIIKDYLQMFT